MYSATEKIPLLLPTEFRDIVQHYAPVPSGEGLANFTELLRDMTKNRSVYYGGGLSSLSAHSSAIDAESVWRLIDRLSPETANNTQHEALLQAKLLLALAEVRDQEEQEIARTLTAIDGQRQLMLHGLTEEEEDEDGEESIEPLPFAQEDRPQRDDTLEKRLRAWSHLFLADTMMPKHWLLSTTPDAFAILDEYTSSQIQEEPNRLLLRLPLPGPTIMGLSATEYLQTRHAWRQEMSVCLATLAVGLQEAANTGVFGASESIQEKLNAHSQKMPAWQGETAATLDIYLLPVSLAKLLAKIAKGQIPESGGSPLPHGIVAVVRPLH